MSAGEASSPLPEYSPPQYLIASTDLSRGDLILQYEAFRETLQYADKAPELMFERLVANLTEALRETWDKDRAKGVAMGKELRREHRVLKAKVEILTASIQKPEIGRTLSSAPVAASPLAPMAAVSKQINLHFWFSADKPNGCYRVWAAATPVPMPYGITNGWLDMRSSGTPNDHGSYDTRMDADITTANLPTTVTCNVRFKNPFRSLPEVAVWLTGFSTTHGAAVSVSVTSNSVTETGFVLQLSSVDGMPLTSAGASWAAWAAWSGDSNYTVSSFSTVTPGSKRVVQLGATGSITHGTSSSPAFCAVDMVVGSNVWMEVVMEKKYGSRETSWCMTAGPVDAKIYSARVAYNSYH